ncbi:MAG: hypothetical protein ACT4QF_15780 [Sporichthyaceae bacterium]
MGVGFVLDNGPACVLWTDTFFPYGVEVFRDPLSDHLSDGPEGPEAWEVTDHRMWAGRIGRPITGASAFWETLEIGPGVTADGRQVSDAHVEELPVALRLDFEAGPVWLAAACVEYPNVDDVFIPGDEIVVAFTREKMQQMGFPEGEFLS